MLTLLALPNSASSSPPRGSQGYCWETSVAQSAVWPSLLCGTSLPLRSPPPLWLSTWRLSDGKGQPASDSWAPNKSCCFTADRSIPPKPQPSGMQDLGQPEGWGDSPGLGTWQGTWGKELLARSFRNNLLYFMPGLSFPFFLAERSNTELTHWAGWRASHLIGRSSQNRGWVIYQRQSSGEYKGLLLTAVSACVSVASERAVCNSTLMAALWP